MSEEDVRRLKFERGTYDKKYKIEDYTSDMMFGTIKFLTKGRYTHVYSEVIVTSYKPIDTNRGGYMGEVDKDVARIIESENISSVA